MKLTRRQLKNIIIEVVKESQDQKFKEKTKSVKEGKTAEILSKITNAYDGIAKNTVGGMLFDKATDAIASDTKSAIRVFVNTYLEMVDFNYANSDKFFHCLANCEAVKHGWSGKKVAEFISELREQTDQIVKGKIMGNKQYDAADSEAYHEANRHGRTAKQDTDCAAHCEKFTKDNLALMPAYRAKRPVV